MGRGQQSSGAARRKLNREKTRQALKTGDTSTTQDTAKEESAMNGMSIVTTILFVYLMGSFLFMMSGRGGSVFEGVDAAKVQKGVSPRKASSLPVVDEVVPAAGSDENPAGEPYEGREAKRRRRVTSCPPS